MLICCLLLSLLSSNFKALRFFRGVSTGAVGACGTADVAAGVGAGAEAAVGVGAGEILFINLARSLAKWLVVN